MYITIQWYIQDNQYLHMCNYFAQLEMSINIDDDET